ncbi:hypothetical protein W97_05286 [Coniosporium apollinis CBS 100218]|uniref:BZIP domain-containing protein n=1 Tax=Coniosporium apollinis (strain CBS 100218) TaxID=1168221 RepID=R7YW16_CONA1|nr:uncharacterized protein W97_05286 [Coniosporium apollinis CBS 100218]EON66043.1 hypothetical protein W97_05286 [Coniosporium apollinis CBS 100218]
MEYLPSEHWLSEEDDFTGSIHLFDLRLNCSTISRPSVSPDEMHSDPFFTPTCPGWYNYTPSPPNHSYHMSAPSGSFDFANDSRFCTSRPPLTNLAFPPAERMELANGVGKISRRRAQNRAAQRAFRERKERRTKDVEIQLATLKEEYRSLECSHAQLSASYEKMRKAMEVLTRGGGEKLMDDANTVRDLLGVLCGEFEIKEEK